MYDSQGCPEARLVQLPPRLLYLPVHQRKPYVIDMPSSAPIYSTQLKASIFEGMCVCVFVCVCVCLTLSPFGPAGPGTPCGPIRPFGKKSRESERLKVGGRRSHLYRRTAEAREKQGIRGGGTPQHQQAVLRCLNAEWVSDVAQESNTL